MAIFRRNPLLRGLGRRCGVRPSGRSTGSLLYRSKNRPDETTRWLTGRALRVTPGARLVFRVSVGPEDEVLWSGAQEDAFTLRTSTAVVRPREAGVHLVVAEIYGPDGRLLGTARAHVEVAEESLRD